jgi:hypothetical protein
MLLMLYTKGRSVPPYSNENGVDSTVIFWEEKNFKFNSANIFTVQWQPTSVRMHGR